MDILIAIALVLVNLVWLMLDLLTLPGNWLMVATTVGVALWRWNTGMISVGTIIAILIIALVAEFAETLSGLAGARRAGASLLSSICAVIGGVVGAVAGTFMIPVPVAGSLAGACIGAALGAWTMELLSGRQMKACIRTGIGAGVGRLLGAIIKVFFGVIIWVIVAFAAFWP